MTDDPVMIEAERALRAAIRELGLGKDDEDRAVAAFRSDEKAKELAVSISRSVTTLKLLNAKVTS